MSQKEMKETAHDIIETFNSIDKNGNGRLEITEILGNFKGVIKLFVAIIGIVFFIISGAQTILQSMGVLDNNPILITASIILFATMFFFYFIVAKMETVNTETANQINTSALQTEQTLRSHINELKQSLAQVKDELNAVKSKQVIYQFALEKSIPIHKDEIEDKFKKSD